MWLVPVLSTGEMTLNESDLTQPSEVSTLHSMKYAKCRHKEI